MPHFLSDHREPGLDPGLDPGRELGRDPSLTTMLGILRKERRLTVDRSASCSDDIPLSFAKAGCGDSPRSILGPWCVGVPGAD